MVSPPNPMLAQYLTQVSQLVDTKHPIVRRVYTELNINPRNQQQTIMTIYNFMINLNYVAEQKDQWQRPSYTLKKRSGDCEDLSSLQASLFSLAGMKNFFVFTYGATWKQYHVENMVLLAKTQSNESEYIYLDASYPHNISALPFYSDTAKVFLFYPVNMPFVSPFLSMTPIPLQTFVQDVDTVRMLTLQPF